MMNSVRGFCAGLHFRFLLLVCGLAFALLAAQLVTDTVSQLRSMRDQRVAEALDVTAFIARSLEMLFEGAAAGEADDILAAVASRPNVRKVSVVDRKLQVFLDGDPLTPSTRQFELSDIQLKSLRSARTEHHIGTESIEVSEPLLANGAAIGAVMIEYRNPGFVETVRPVLAAKMMTMLPILVTGLLFAAGLVSQITAPLRNLSMAASAFSEGNLEQLVRVEGAREVRQLGEAFNAMIKRLRESIEEIYNLAYVDRVTQLPNREYFRKEVSRSINRAHRNGFSGALLFVDLDGFKRVNDTHGHDLGDKLLAKFSERISTVIRTEDTVTWQAPAIDGTEDAAKSQEKQVLARLGGDEFTILLSEIREETDAATVARRIIKAVNEPFVFDGAEVRIGASVGIATFPRDGSDYKSVLKCADMAMYQAKDDGKNTFRFFSTELNARATKRIEMEIDLRKALTGGELELYYQPKVECISGNVTSVEALVRWNHPEKGMIHPGEFITLAEECGLSQPLGEWVLKRACRQIGELEEAGLCPRIAVNVSSQQFERSDFAQKVLRIVRNKGVNPHHLELEITEAMAMANPKRALDHIRQLKRAGVRFALDDFGTGHSNLSQLSRLPFDVFKIDRSFVQMLADETDDHGRIIVRTILALAQSLGNETVAEGVETEEQRRILTEAGCTHAQGYLFARPMPAFELVEYLVADRQRRESKADSKAA